MMLQGVGTGVKMPPIQACFLIPLAKPDLRRIVWTIRSIRQYCSDYRIFILADGRKQDFSEPLPKGEDVQIVFAAAPSGGHTGKIWQMLNHGLRVALYSPGLSANCVFFKVDADAMVVRSGLIERAQGLFATNPRCGQLGQCFQNIIGKPIENAGWANYFNRRRTPFGVAKTIFLFMREGIGTFAAVSGAFRLREIIRTAEANGYPLGKFCQGGAYALRLDAAKALEKAGFLTDSPFRWIPSKSERGGMGEDIRWGVHLYAVGFHIMDDIRENGIFAIYAKHPLVHPLKLRERGHYIIHPTKYGSGRHEPKMTEEELISELVGINEGAGSLQVDAD